MSSDNLLDQFIDLLPEGADKRMRKFCRSLERGETPDGETLAYFKDRFTDVLSIVDEPTDILRDKLPSALGINIKKQGRPSPKLSVGVCRAIDVQMLRNDGVPRTEAIETIAGEGEFSTVESNYKKFGKHAKKILAFRASITQQQALEEDYHRRRRLIAAELIAAIKNNTLEEAITISMPAGTGTLMETDEAPVEILVTIPTAENASDVFEMLNGSSELYVADVLGALSNTPNAAQLFHETPLFNSLDNFAERIISAITSEE